MYQRKLPIGILLLVTLCLIIAGCGGSSSHRFDGQSASYLRNNIHVQEHKHQEYRASYANWTDPGKGHIIVPVNTLVTIGTFRRGFTIITQAGHTIFFEYDEKNMGMSSEQYIALITSPQPVALNNLSEIDLKGVKDGKAYVGMTKSGVRIALGYPAIHRTPSLDSNTWIYWTNRFKSIAIEFNEKGIVKKIG
jgi:hypothetical protein